MRINDLKKAFSSQKTAVIQQENVKGENIVLKKKFENFIFVTPGHMRKLILRSRQNILGLLLALARMNAPVKISFLITQVVLVLKQNNKKR